MILGLQDTEWASPDVIRKFKILVTNLYKKFIRLFILRL